MEEKLKRITTDEKHWVTWGIELEKRCSSDTEKFPNQVKQFIFDDFKKYYMYMIEKIGKSDTVKETQDEWGKMEERKLEFRFI